MSTPASHHQPNRPGPHQSPAGDNAMFDGPKAGSVLSAPAPDAGSSTQERIVLLMAVLVSAAAAGVLHLLGGWPLAYALPVGVVTLGVSLLANALASRNAETSRLRLEIARLELELARLKTQSLPNRPAQSELETGVLVSKAALPAEARWDVAAARRARGAQGSAGDATAAPANSSGTAGQQPAAEGAAQVHVAGQKTKPPRDPMREAQPAAPRPARSQREEIPAWAAPSADQGDALRAGWEKAVGEAAEEPAQQPATFEAPRMPALRTVESDLELVQRKIKALADEVNANDGTRTIAAPEMAPPAIDESISALRSTAERMRPRKGFSARPNYAEMAQQPAQPSPPQPSQAAPRLQQPAAAKPAMKPPSEPRAAQPQPQPAFAKPTPPVPSSTGPTELPSLDALIPATAQPIAVSGPSQEAAASGNAAPQTIASMPSQARAPESSRFAEAPRMDHAMQVPPWASEPQRPAAAPQTPHAEGNHSVAREAIHAAPPMDRRAAPGRRQQDLHIAEIAAAIEQRRMDVYLNPIVGLGDYAVTHFEVDVRLRAEGGGYIDGAEQTLRLQSSDMLALFDIERLQRTALVAEQLDARGKSGSVLSPTSGQSMSDGGFLEAFARTFETRIAISNQLVLTFTQQDVSAFGPSTWQALADMASFGFRFALQEVTHLSMDFAALAERGFGFVKLPASAFLDGLPAGHGLVPPADICRHLAGAGLTLVVESIDDDQMLGRVFGFGALFGQGTLFGGSRQITLDALGPKRAA